MRLKLSLSLKQPNWRKPLAWWLSWRERHPKTYRVYTHPGKKTVAVKRGFCWPAFFFTPLLWLPARGLWSQWFVMVLLAFTNWVALGVVILQYPPNVNDVAQPILMLLPVVLFFFVARRCNAWREEKLLARHYTRQIEYQAASAKQALSLWNARIAKVKAAS